MVARTSEHGLPEVTGDEWHRFARFLEHSWFSSAWVFQESLVAKRSVFIYGDCAILQADLFQLLPEAIAIHHLEGYIDRTPRMELSPMMRAAQRCTSIFLAQGSIAMASHYAAAGEHNVQNHRSSGPCVCSPGSFERGGAARAEAGFQGACQRHL